MTSLTRLAGESWDRAPWPAEALVRENADAVALALTRTRPDLYIKDITVATEAATRLAISHIVLPLHPTEAAADHIACLVERYLGPTPAQVW